MCAFGLSATSALLGGRSISNGRGFFQSPAAHNVNAAARRHPDRMHVFAVCAETAAHGWWGRSLRALYRRRSGKEGCARAPPARPLAGRARRLSSWRRAWTW